MADHTADVRCRVPRSGLLGRLGLDDDRLAQVHAAGRRRAPAENLLAQQGVELHAAEALLLLVDRRDAAGLVVDDYRARPGGDVETVDDAPQA